MTSKSRYCERLRASRHRERCILPLRTATTTDTLGTLPGCRFCSTILLSRRGSVFKQTPVDLKGNYPSRVESTNPFASTGLEGLKTRNMRCVEQDFTKVLNLFNRATYCSGQRC